MLWADTQLCVCSPNFLPRILLSAGNTTLQMWSLSGHGQLPAIISPGYTLFVYHFVWTKCWVLHTYTRMHKAFVSGHGRLLAIILLDHTPCAWCVCVCSFLFYVRMYVRKYVYVSGHSRLPAIILLGYKLFVRRYVYVFTTLCFTYVRTYVCMYECVCVSSQCMWPWPNLSPVGWLRFVGSLKL